jgi:hypothetical protein
MPKNRMMSRMKSGDPWIATSRLRQLTSLNAGHKEDNRGGDPPSAT